MTPREKVRAFVIAMECEAEAVRPALRATDRLYVSGVGKVNAAASTQRAIDEGATEIWNCGLCGGFDPAIRVGDIYAVSAAVEYDFDLAKINGTRVGQLDGKDSPYFKLSVAESFRAAARVLATGDRFNDSDDDLALLAELGCTLRDMEGAAVAHVCERNGIPCTAFKCVSDVHGLGAMTGQYLENKRKCLVRLTEFLCAYES